MKKPTAELSSFARAQIIRGLYDAADKAVGEQSEAGSSSEPARLAFDELRKVIAQARDLGGDEFAQTIETAAHKYTEQISTVQRDNAPNAEPGE